jgi:hypothetical protein
MVSTYLAQHAEFEAPAIDGEHFRPYWRKQNRTRLDDLLAEKAIGTREYLAAILYRDLIARAVQSAWGGWRTETIDRSTSSLQINGRASAESRLADIRAQLGGFAAVLIDLVVVLDLPWRELGRRYRVDPKTIKRYAVTTLQLLAGVMWR